MDCRALDALNPTFFTISLLILRVSIYSVIVLLFLYWIAYYNDNRSFARGKLLLLTPLCDGLPPSLSPPSPPVVSSELLYLFSARPDSPSAFPSYAKTPCRLLLLVLTLSVMLFRESLFLLVWLTLMLALLYL